MSPFAGPCMRCGNEVELRYFRQSKRGSTLGKRLWVCANCADLSDGSDGRVTYRSGYANAGNPRCQPAEVKGVKVPQGAECVLCQSQGSLHAYPWAFGDLAVIYACGWGHAGIWMDQQIDQYELDEGEAYVRRSLGIEN